MIHTNPVRKHSRIALRNRSLFVEQLEHRRLLTIFVTTPLDVVDPADNLTSLREAIIQANATPGETIEFAGTVFNGEMNDVIRLNSQLPIITADMTIDATGAAEVVISGDVNADDTPVANSKLTDLSATPVSERDDNVRLLEIIAGSTNLIGLTLTGGRKFDLLERGGAVFFTSPRVESLTVTNSIISGNESNFGGGIDAIYGSVTISDTTVSGNTATSSITRGFGGGVTSFYGSLEIANSTFSGNFGEYGGAILTGSGAIKVANSAISGNRSTLGGGLMTYGGAVEVINSTISGNSSVSLGGGIYALDAPVLVENSTIVGNQGYNGGGIDFGSYFASYQSLTMRNSIVAGNSTTNGSSLDISSPANPANNLLVEYSLIGNDTGSGLNLGISNNNLTNVDPLIGPLTNNGGETLTHELLAGSPAINTGDPNFDETIFTPPMVNDQRGIGYSRVSSGRIDMGAYEVPPVLYCDVDSDGDCDIDDIDAVITAIAAATNDLQFDVNFDGSVDLLDRDQWLMQAGEANLGPGRRYLLADANLDGNVDGSDFLTWNDNKFTSTAKWSQGDWDANGVTDGRDFLIWNDHKFTSADESSSWLASRTSRITADCLDHKLTDHERLSLWIEYLFALPNKD